MKVNLTENDDFTVPCAIWDGKSCTEPFCKFVYFSGLADKWLHKWMDAMNKELKTREVKKCTK